MAATTTDRPVPELTFADVRALRAGDVLHYTNHPCRPSVPVAVLRDGCTEVRAAGGQKVHAFADELTYSARTGLGGGSA